MANLTFTAPKTKRYTPVYLDSGISFNLRSIDKDINVIVKKNLPRLADIIKVHVAKTVGEIVLDLMSKVQPRIPVDTGELRESGRGRLLLGPKWVNIAKGTNEGTIIDLTGKINAGLLKGSTRMVFNVGYTRTNERGENVALMMHEDIYHYDARALGFSPAAKTVGTGPKYLETPLNEALPGIQKALIKSVERAAAKSDLR